jgi:hypothetical protein
MMTTLFAYFFIDHIRMNLGFERSDLFAFFSHVSVSNFLSILTF